MNILYENQQMQMGVVKLKDKTVYINILESFGKMEWRS